MQIVTPLTDIMATTNGRRSIMMFSITTFDEAKSGTSKGSVCVATLEHGSVAVH
jgi:hypothetical protein